MEKVRLQKYLAEAGIASRRKCEEYILEGKVKVNGEIVKELGTKIDAEKDKVLFEGKTVKKESELVYILLNKPTGYVTTTKEQMGRKMVLDLLKDVKTRILPVGRLDMYTSGALILTNDGDFIYKITHPKHEVNKTYIARVKGIVKEQDIEALRTGVKIEDYTTSPAIVEIIEIDKEKKLTKLEITIHEGKNRQVRKMCESLGYGVYSLHRYSIGQVSVKGLKRGNWRYLTDKEVKSLL